MSRRPYTLADLGWTDETQEPILFTAEDVAFLASCRISPA